MQAASSAAERQRRARARRRSGITQYRLELGDEVIEALLRSGALSADEALRHPLVERQLSEVLVTWARRWCEA